MMFKRAMAFLFLIAAAIGLLRLLRGSAAEDLRFHQDVGDVAA